MDQTQKYSKLLNLYGEEPKQFKTLADWYKANPRYRVDNDNDLFRKLLADEWKRHQRRQQTQPQA